MSNKNEKKYSPEKVNELIAASRRLIIWARRRYVDCEYIVGKDDIDKLTKALKELVLKEDTKPCCMCGKELESALPYEDKWATMQPVDGGEIVLYFGYGSGKFDNYMGGTCFNGLICDDCAEPLMDRLEDISDA